jgi:hypothetical protein
MRICNVCKTNKSLGEFHNCKSFPLGKVYTCKVCAKQKTLDWAATNPERKKQTNKKHYEENKQDYILRAKKAEWSKRNKERVKVLSKARYTKRNGAADVAKYRHLRRRAAPRWLTKEHLQEIEQFYWLAKDLKAVTGETYHVDHIIPINGENVSGLHVPWNLQVLPADINISKGNRLED